MTMQPQRQQPQRADDVVDADFEELPATSSLARSQPQAMTRIATQYVTAMVVPIKRDLKEVEKACLREAKLVAEDFHYSWTVNSKTGKQTIEGVSIDGAMIMMRNFGNCTCEVMIAEDAPTHWVFRATFIDFETGFNLSRNFRQRKSERHGRFDEERALDIAMQIGQSKAQRNVIEKSMPRWLVNGCELAAKEAAAAKITDLPKAIENWSTSFIQKGVPLSRLESRIGAPKAQWTKPDILLLAAIWKSLKDRQTTIDQEFPTLDVPPENETPVADEAPAAQAQAPSPPASPPTDTPKPKRAQREPGEEG